jgi:Negative regulator of sigma F
MSPGHEIDYEALIDRSIKDFQPVKRLWPVGARLVCWILLDAAILSWACWVRGDDNLRTLFHNFRQVVAAGLFISASIATAFLALKSAIPGRELSWPQLAIAIPIVAAAFSFEPAAVGPFNETLASAPTSMLQLFSLAALSWLSLFWGVRRGVPLQPEVTGAAVGLAAVCFGLALCQIISQPVRLPNSGIVLALCSTAVIVLSALAGGLWLNWIARWQQKPVAAEVSTSKWATFNAGTVFPLALGASIVALLFVLKGPGQQIARIPDFDLAIESYQRALVDFRPNVPSTSMETLLTAYVEHGMPAYMWDFGPEGFTLVGGRWGRLPDGTPVTYTWFRGAKGGVMCMFRQTDAFNPPMTAHDEHHRLLFYRYRNFSLCLINVGGYGNFISVIAAPMPLKQFEHLVLAATL